MAKYLGQFDVDINNHPEFSKYTSSDWAMYFISRYGQIDGAHHKNWVLDQVARILKGTKVVVVLAKWDDGNSEYRVWLEDIPTLEYNKWRQEMLGDLIDGEYEYSYDEGTAP